MKQSPKPIHLLADSRLLFRGEGGTLLLDSIRRLAAGDRPAAAYLGASNGDAPEFYSIFEAAMDGAGVRRRRMIRRSFSAQDRAFLDEADIILLAGGEVERGWGAFVETGMREFVLRRYREGAVLIGISAGASQLGLYAPAEGGPSVSGLLRTFGLVPFVIDSHDEAREWVRLRGVLRLLGGGARGFGIPTGGGLVYHPEGRVEAVGRPLRAFSIEGGEIRDAPLAPGGGGDGTG